MISYRRGVNHEFPDAASGGARTSPQPGLSRRSTAGIMQVNVRVPEDTAPGDAPLVLTVGGYSSQSGITVAVE